MYEKLKNNKKIIIIISMSVIIIIGAILHYFIKPTEKANNELNAIKNNSNTNNATNLNDNSENEFFRMMIDTVFTFESRGTVVAGTIESGNIKVNDHVQIVGLNNENKIVTVTQIEKNREYANSAKVGDSVTISLKDIKADELENRQFLATPNSLHPVTKFSAELDLSESRKKGEDGQFFDLTKIKFSFRSQILTGTIKVLDDRETINVGDKIEISVELESPVIVGKGTSFNLKDGRPIGRGIVTQVYE